MILLLLALQGAPAELRLEKQPTRVEIKAAGETVAVYVFDDPAIKRPYLAHVRAPGGPQVTRNHPPVEGKDLTDHAAMHPGIWLGFGDLDGVDFWRNKGRVVTEKLEVEGSTIAAVFSYKDGNRLVCRETARLVFQRRPEGLRVRFDSSFASEKSFVFGDQEEMGLGVRLATPLAVKSGGRILDSAGRRNEKEIWGKSADWVAYGTAKAGLLLVPHPENFRPSWMHARDYGVLVANPFGRKAFTQGEASRIEVKPGESLRLRYAVLAYTGEIDLGAVATALLKD